MHNFTFNHHRKGTHLTQSFDEQNKQAISCHVILYKNTPRYKYSIKCFFSGESCRRIKFRQLENLIMWADKNQGDDIRVAENCQADMATDFFVLVKVADFCIKKYRPKQHV